MPQGNQEHLMSEEEKNQKKSNIQNVQSVMNTRHKLLENLHAFKYILVALLAVTCSAKSPA